jgi:hypothetical protein
MKYSLYIDESGDHVLQIDKNYPIFVLCGVLLSEDEHNNKLTKLLNDLKVKYFGRSSVILHTAEFLRPKKNPNSIYYPLHNEDKRYEFFKDLDNLIQKIDFEIVTVAVSKPDHLEYYAEAAQDPYLLSIKPLVENVCVIYQELALNEPIDFIAESREKTLDGQLLNTYDSLKYSGTRGLTVSDIAKMVKFCQPILKLDNIAGLQLADLVVTPIGRNLLNRTQYLNYSTIEHKFRKNGLIRVPKDWTILARKFRRKLRRDAPLRSASLIANIIAH